ncbi:MAG: bifunctional DNA primase/helicase, partial [Aquabacterium sp.]|nr:bifunctional DNA primase/helicase [Aquabacterium sp.]
MSGIQPMKPDLHDQVMRSLGEFAFKTNGKWLQKGECPSCHKKELFASAESPWVIRCSRINNCGYEAHVKELYPELFTDWSKRAAPELPKNPNAAADLYLNEARGFDLSRIKGWYRQESHYDPKADNGKGAGSATVR